MKRRRAPRAFVALVACNVAHDPRQPRAAAARFGKPRWFDRNPDLLLAHARRHRAARAGAGRAGAARAVPASAADRALALPPGRWRWRCWCCSARRGGRAAKPLTSASLPNGRQVDQRREADAGAPAVPRAEPVRPAERQPEGSGGALMPDFSELARIVDDDLVQGGGLGELMATSVTGAARRRQQGGPPAEKFSRRDRRSTTPLRGVRRAC